LILNLDYGTTGLKVELPDERTTIIEPQDRPGAARPTELLIDAIRSPVTGPSLSKLIRAGQKVGISVCDITRAQPRRLMLEALFAEMPGIGPDDITLFIATGTHRANTRDELIEMLGTEIATNYRIVCHDARDYSALIRAGDTKKGVPVFLNRQWLESDFKITTGFVEPHFFAGFSGGPKMVAPGLAGLETVLHLHDAPRIAHPNATWGITEGNPIHDDVREISGMTGVDFAVDVTLNRRKEITAAFAGQLFDEHAAACRQAKTNAMQAVDAAFDVVLTTNSGYPLDQNLYQSVKGMSAAAKIVKPGGTIICAAECRDGIPDHGAYKEILASCSSPQEMLDKVTAPDYRQPDQWQVQVQAQIQLNARVLVKSDGLSDKKIRDAHFEPVTDVSEATRIALRDAGAGSTLCVLPQGPQTIPYLKNTSSLD
jgi:nickel-dependent lactate racemase